MAFGNENEKQFNDAIKNLSKIRFAYMNIFIYSRRKNTAADKLYKQDINPIVARKRYNKVVKLKNKFRKEYLRTLINKELKVLVEKPTGSLMHGYSSEFVKVYFKSGKNLRGQIVNVKPEKIIEDRTGPCLLGKRI
ncbi:MAG: hypothetical protein MJ223_02055 [Mycoplasmoidaceae bacterium]|nr:hypothetical protein [Mycoplasmoidaceae bacterium]